MVAQAWEERFGVPAPSVEAMMLFADANCDGKIGIDEFKAAMTFEPTVIVPPSARPISTSQSTALRVGHPASSWGLTAR